MEETATIHPAAVIFDMDGLMLDTEGPLISLFAQAGKPLGWDITPESVMQTAGLDAAGMRKSFMEEYGPDFPYDRIRENLSRLMDFEFNKGITHKKGLLHLLDHLSSLKIPLAVATSTRRERALWKLEKAGLSGRFPVLACGDEVTRGKPAPDIFLLAAERLGQAPAECVGFEDAPAGLLGLHAAGIRSVFVMDMIDAPPEILATVWRRCADLEEAAALFA